MEFIIKSNKIMGSDWKSKPKAYTYLSTYPIYTYPRPEKYRIQGHVKRPSGKIKRPSHSLIKQYGLICAKL